jgi:hypothetical protein
MEAEYIKSAVGPILTEALQSLILHVPYPGVKQSDFATTIDPIDYLGQYLLRHAEKEEEQKILEELRAADRVIIDNFADEQARLEITRSKLGHDLTVRGDAAEEAILQEEQIIETISEVASTTDTPETF